MVILPNHITQLQDTTTAQTTLTIQFYVKLPELVNRSPYRATNYVVPRATLKHIVSQDGEVIGAVVRNSVTPSLTEQLLDVWRVAASVCLLVICVAVCVAVVVGAGFAWHKYRQM